MNKRELALLEKAFMAEINAASSRHGIHLMQTRAKLAEQLVADGYLAHCSVVLGGRFPITLNGYELTHAGRLAYCMTCEGEPC